MRLKPFNDALKHQQTTGGGGGGKVSYKRLPLGIRIIGYFIRFCIITAVVMVLFNWILRYF
ncbi:hypothetical protein V1502_14075 [Bacillus sp. SCS-153A]|uniref:hypothetical protein n=1 Tax=Rossellomorea sedimentorum TaxID=3115294 RepID=UPI0039059F26